VASPKVNQTNLVIFGKVDASVNARFDTVSEKGLQ
jgi:hypothetical protein